MNISINSTQLEELTGDERTLVVVALHRKGLTASNAVFTVCKLAGKEQPSEDILGCVKFRMR